MRTRFLKTIALSSVIALTLVGCDKNDGPDGPDNPNASGPDIWDREYITITWAFPDGDRAGNGGTKAYAISLEQAADPNFELNISSQGYGLRSQRTARVQSSMKGNFLYNIQYTGDDGGIFNKYKVEGAANFEDTREELNTEPILGSAPRWVVAAEGIGVGVYASSEIAYTGEGTNAEFEDVTSTARIAVLDLDDPQITRQTEFEIPFTDEQKKDGYQIGRIDVPVLNAAKNKVFIGCRLSRTDVTKNPTLTSDGDLRWASAANELGTATLVVDYPSLANPKLIYSSNSTESNNSYRTMTQYVGSDGNIYQATATSGSQILRIDGATGEYDNGYNFDLKSALGTANDVQIKAWRYIKDGKGIVLYTESGVAGGYIALVDLNGGLAKKLNTENQTDVGFSGNDDITGTFGQFQHIGVDGNNVYIPMTPNGADGNLYIVDVVTEQIKKGAKLINQSGSFYIGAY